MNEKTKDIQPDADVSRVPLDCIVGRSIFKNGELMILAGCRTGKSHFQDYMKKKISSVAYSENKGFVANGKV